MNYILAQLLYELLLINITITNDITNKVLQIFKCVYGFIASRRQFSATNIIAGHPPCQYDFQSESWYMDCTLSMMPLISTTPIRAKVGLAG